MMKLRDYQVLAVEHAVQFLKDEDVRRSIGPRLLYSAPTGTGKTVVEIEVQRRLESDRAWILTPKVEIIGGMLDKMGVSGAFSMSKPALVELGLQHRIATPMTLKNKLMSGQQLAPEYLILDEAHHHRSSTYELIDLLCGMCPSVGYTATPFRGTPGSTLLFNKSWPERISILTYPEAQSRGVIQIPTCETIPLIDDDVIEVKNGEFVVQQIANECKSRLEDVVSLCWDWVTDADRWDKPTMFAVPTVEICHLLADMLDHAGFPAVAVTGKTPFWERVEAFDDTVTRKKAMVQVQVVSEGVDLPIRRLVDLHPMLSPVEWLQQLGRITRPGGESEYLCVNRNLIRHGYLLAGCIPPAVVAAAQKAFPPSVRSAAARTIGLEALGRFKPIGVPCVDGCEATAWALTTSDGATSREYCVITHPARPEPIWATRLNAPSLMQWGRWQRCEPPTALEGFASVNSRALSDKQKAWFTRSAAYHGLQPDVDAPKKVFVAFTVLEHLREKLP